MGDSSQIVKNQIINEAKTNVQKMKSIPIAPVLCADNTHLIVQEKLEKYRK